MAGGVGRVAPAASYRLLLDVQHPSRGNFQHCCVQNEEQRSRWIGCGDGKASDVSVYD